MAQLNPYEASNDLSKRDVNNSELRYPLIRLATSTAGVLIGGLLLLSWLLFIAVNVLKSFSAARSDVGLPVSDMKVHPLFGLFLYTVAFAVPGCLWMISTRCFWTERYLKGVMWLVIAVISMALGRLFVEMVVLK